MLLDLLELSGFVLVVTSVVKPPPAGIIAGIYRSCTVRDMTEARFAELRRRCIFDGYGEYAAYIMIYRIQSLSKYACS